MIILDKNQEIWTIYFPNPYSTKPAEMELHIENLETLKEYSPAFVDIDPDNPYFYKINLTSYGYKAGEYKYTLKDQVPINETPKYISSGIIKII